MLIVAEFLVGIAAAYAIIRFIVIPAMRTSDSSGGPDGRLPGDGTDNQNP